MFRLADGYPSIIGSFPSNSPLMIVTSESTTDNPPFDEFAIVTDSRVTFDDSSTWTRDPAHSHDGWTSPLIKVVMNEETGSEGVNVEMLM